MLCKTEHSLVWMFDSYIIISVKTIDNILLTTLLTSNMTDQIQTMMKDWEHSLVLNKEIHRKYN